MSKHVLAFLHLFSVLFLGAFFDVYAQELPRASLTNPGATSLQVILDGEPPARALSSNQVLEQFIKAETLVRDSLNHHTFKRDVLLQTIGPNGEVTGDYIRRSQFVFDDRGNRIERVLYHPAPSLRNMKITKEDIQDLAGAQLLGLDITETGKYRLDFVGAEKLGGRPVFAIDVSPRTTPNPHKMRERFFIGRVWADANTFQIVKARGKVEPQGKQRFPQFETWRETPQGDLLFPSRTDADDILRFPKFDVHYRVQVKYYDYKLFASKLTIKEIDEPAPVSDSSNSRPSANASERDGTVCKTNLTAPPVSRYSWPPDKTIRVYFMRNMFTVEQRRTLFAAMADWSGAAKRIGAGVTFVDAGDSDSRVSCNQCLTIARKDASNKGRYYAYFFPVKYDRNGWLKSAWIEFDVATTDPKALQGYMAHELGHGMGLENCTTCKKKQTIMNSFPAINRNNGLISPSPCDLEVVRRIYDEHRKLSRTSAESVAAIPDGR
jgi:hypothetical protein